MKRVAVLCVLGTTLGIAAPVASASAGGGGLNGQTVRGAVTGPVVITTAPSSFVNTNNQISPGGNASGSQVAP